MSLTPFDPGLVPIKLLYCVYLSCPSLPARLTWPNTPSLSTSRLSKFVYSLRLVLLCLAKKVNDKYGVVAISTVCVSYSSVFTSTDVPLAV